MSNRGEQNFSREGFFEQYSHLLLREKVESIEKRNPDFWTNLERIRSHYERSIDQYKSALSVMIDEISKADMSDPTIHSIRYRVKDVDSLLIKIIDKSVKVPTQCQSNPEIEKYRYISDKNYYKIITDLVGVRILIRYRYQWQSVHNLIWQLYHSDGREYVVDWENDYIYDPALKFIAEKPKAYIKQESDRSIYEAIGKNIFHILPSDNHYASLHYLVNQSGTYVELQVRTIFDEAWCECSHDFVYKTKVRSDTEKYILERLSTILAQHTTASDEIVSLMCDIAKPSCKITKANSNADEETKHNAEKNAKTFSCIKQRARLLSEQNDNKSV